MAAFGQSDDCRAFRGPHEQGNGFIDYVANVVDRIRAVAHDIEPTQSGESKADRQRAYIVTARRSLLNDQAAAAVTDKITMRLAGGHAGGCGQSREGLRLRRRGERAQQPRSDLDRLNALPVLLALGHSLDCTMRNRMNNTEFFLPSTSLLLV